MVTGALLVLAAFAPWQQTDSVRATGLLNRPARLVVREIRIVAALDSLAVTSGVRLAFSPSMLEGRIDRVSCDCARRSVGEALDQLLAGTRTGYTELDGRVVIFRPAPPARSPAADPVVILAPSDPSPGTEPSGLRGGTIAGRVVDARSGQPVEAAVVTVLNGPGSAISASDGRFTLSHVAEGHQTVVVVRVGYARTTATVAVREGAAAQLEVRLGDRTTRLHDLVVTAEKAEQEVEDIPAAVSVISSEQIENARLTNTTDLSGLVPNVVTTFAATAGVSVITIRGINSSTASTFENSVATYVDGVYQADVAAAGFNLGEIERIEILRGPQGTLYGRGAMAGVINVITKGPSNRRRAVVSAEYGKYAAARYRAAAAGPLVADRLFYSVDGQHARRDGYFYNTFTRRDFDGRRDWAGNARLKFVASPRLSLGFNARAERNKNLGIFPVAPNDSIAFARPYEVAFDAENIDRRNIASGSFDVRYFGSRVEVVSVTGYQRTFRGTGPGGLEADLTPSPLRTSTYGQPGFTEPGNHNDVWSEELRVSSPRSRDGRLGWTLGAYGFRQRNPAFVDIFTDSLISSVGQSFHNLTENRTDVDGYAVFGQASYTVTPKLDLTLGLRYDHQTTALSTARELRFRNGTVIPGQSVTAENPSASVSPKASLAYRAGDRLLAYATYARGYRAGGANLSGLTSVVPRTYGPEYIGSYEIGLKGSTRDGRLRANLTGFFIDWTDAQVSSFDLSTFESGTVNSGKVTSRGIEVELSALPVDRLEIDWNFGSTAARYDRLDLSLDPSRPFDLSGNRPPLVPTITSTVASVVEIPIAARAASLALRGEWRYLGSHFFDLANTIEQKGYSLFGATATIRTRTVDLAAWGSNLGGRRFIAYGFAFGARFVMLGPPRTFGLTATFHPWR